MVAFASGAPTIQRRETIIPGDGSYVELGAIAPSFFISVDTSSCADVYGRMSYASIGKVHGGSEIKTYVSFDVPAAGASMPGVNANTKCFLAPLPDNISGSPFIDTFSLLPGFTLPSTLTCSAYGSDQNLARLTYGPPPHGVDVVSIDNFVTVPCNWGGKQEFLVRATGDDASAYFNGLDSMALVIANI